MFDDAYELASSFLALWFIVMNITKFDLKLTRHGRIEANEDDAMMKNYFKDIT